MPAVCGDREEQVCLFFPGALFWLLWCLQVSGPVPFTQGTQVLPVLRVIDGEVGAQDEACPAQHMAKSFRPWFLPACTLPPRLCTRLVGLLFLPVAPSVYPESPGFDSAPTLFWTSPLASAPPLTTQN